MRQGNTHTRARVFLGVVEGNEKIKGSCFLFVCLVSRKSGIERERGESGRVWQRKFGVQCATEISAAAERTCGSFISLLYFPRRILI